MLDERRGTGDDYGGDAGGTIGVIMRDGGGGGGGGGPRGHRTPSLANTNGPAASIKGRLLGSLSMGSSANPASRSGFSLTPILGAGGGGGATGPPGPGGVGGGGHAGGSSVGVGGSESAKFIPGGAGGGAADISASHIITRTSSEVSSSVPFLATTTSEYPGGAGSSATSAVPAVVSPVAAGSATGNVRAGLGTHLVAKKVYEQIHLEYEAEARKGVEGGGAGRNPRKRPHAEIGSTRGAARDVLASVVERESVTERPGHGLGVTEEEEEEEDDLGDLPVPSLELAAAAEDGGMKESEHGCAVAFIDISGYSKLTAELTARYGSVGGSTLIRRLINPVVEGIVYICDQHGGDIIKFCGDSVTVCWSPQPGKDPSSTLLSAMGCCQSLLDKFSSYSVVLPAVSSIISEEGPYQEFFSGGGLYVNNFGGGASNANIPNSVLPVNHTNGFNPNIDHLQLSRNEFGRLFRATSARKIHDVPDAGSPTSPVNLSALESEDLPGKKKKGSTAVAPAPNTSDTRYMKLHIGLGYGTVCHMHVGKKGQRLEYFIGGPATFQAASVLDFAKSGELAVSQQAWEIFSRKVEDLFPPLKSDLLVERGPDNSIIVKRFGKQSAVFLRSTAVSTGGSRLIEESTKVEVPRERWFVYLNESLAYQLSIGTGVHDERELNEIRTVTAMFVRLTNLKEAHEDEDYLYSVSQNLMEVAMRVVKDYGASIRQITFDEKGLTLLMIWGLPPFTHEIEGPFALRASIEIRDALAASHLLKDATFSIAIASGAVFSGVVGGDARIDQTVLGTCINLAARLMVNPLSKSSVLVDSQTYSQVDEDDFLFSEPHLLTVKGALTAVKAYVLVGVNRRTNRAAQGREVKKVIGRKPEQKRIWSFIEDWADGESVVIPIIGVTGMGKSLMLSSLLQELTNTENVVAWYENMAIAAENRRGVELISGMLQPRKNPAFSGGGRRVSYAIAGVGQSLHHSQSTVGVNQNQSYGDYASTASQRVKRAAGILGQRLNFFAASTLSGGEGSTKQEMMAETMYESVLREAQKSFTEVETQLLELVRLLGHSTQKLPLFNKVMNVNFPPSSLTRNLNEDAVKYSFKSFFTQILETLYRSANIEIAIIVDSVQYMDSSSWELLQYTVQRCSFVLIILASRPIGEYPEAYKGYFESFLDLAGADHMVELYGISEEAAEAIVLQELGHDGKSLRLEKKLLNDIMLKSFGVPSICEMIGQSLRSNRSQLFVHNNVLHLNEGVFFDELVQGDNSFSRSLFRESELEEIDSMLNNGKAMKDFLMKNDIYGFVKVIGDLTDPGTVISFNDFVISRAIYSLIDPQLQTQLHQAAVEAYRGLIKSSNEEQMLPKIINHLGKFPQSSLEDKIYYTDRCFKKFCTLRMIPESVQMGQSLLILLQRKRDWSSPRVEAMTLGIIYSDLASLHAFEYWTKTIQHAKEALRHLCGYVHPTTPGRLIMTVIKTFFKALKAVKLFMNRGRERITNLREEDVDTLEIKALRARMRTFSVLSNYFLQANLVVDGVLPPLNIILAVCERDNKLPQWGATSFYVLASICWMLGLKQRARFMRSAAAQFHEEAHNLMHRLRDADDSDGDAGAPRSLRSQAIVTVEEEVNMILYASILHITMDPWGSEECFAFGCRAINRMAETGALLNYQAFNMVAVVNLLAVIIGDYRMQAVNALKLWQNAIQVHPCSFFSGIAALSMTGAYIEDYNPQLAYIWYHICKEQMERLNGWDGQQMDSYGVHFFGHKAVMNFRIYFAYEKIFHLALSKDRTVYADGEEDHDEAIFPHIAVVHSPAEGLASAEETQYASAAMASLADDADRASSSKSQQDLKTNFLRRTTRFESGWTIGDAERRKKASKDSVGPASDDEDVRMNIKTFTSEDVLESALAMTNAVTSGIPAPLITPPAFFDLFVSTSRWWLWVKMIELRRNKYLSLYGLLDEDQVRERDFAMEKRGLTSLVQSCLKACKAGKRGAPIFAIAYQAFQAVDVLLKGRIADAIAILWDLLHGKAWEKMYSRAKVEGGTMSYSFDKDTSSHAKKKAEGLLQSMGIHKAQQSGHRKIPVEDADANSGNIKILSVVSPYMTGVLCARLVAFSYLNAMESYGYGDLPDEYASRIELGDRKTDTMKRSGRRGYGRVGPEYTAHLGAPILNRLQPSASVVERCAGVARKNLSHLKLELDLLALVTGKGFQTEGEK
ncbi:Adenylate cyclase type 10 [Phlyctochytrium bullatum]|nr:Adenylate cyclase type 10 [Phlyctochytrium bullatum]